jgi:YggT family protein
LTLIIDALSWLSLIVFWASAIIAGLLVLRVIVSYATSNPFAWLPYHLRKWTEPLVRPMRGQFDGRTMRFDLLPLVAAVIVFIMGLMTVDLLVTLSSVFSNLYRTALHGTVMVPGFLIKQFVTLALLLYIVAILLRILLPLFGIGYRNALLRFVYGITEPVLRPLRRFFLIGMFDLSPWVAIIIIRFVLGFIATNIG